MNWYTDIQDLAWLVTLWYLRFMTNDKLGGGLSTRVVFHDANRITHYGDVVESSPCRYRCKARRKPRRRVGERQDG
jgi:hypothetical protein